METQLKQVYKKKIFSNIPEHITSNPILNAMISVLPGNYNFEIHKSVNRILQVKKELNKDIIKVALQLPQGLQMFACLLSDIFETFTQAECIIFGDETYGACCIDDIGAFNLGCDLMIHYGHSCLVPISDVKVKCLYVFVDILIDIEHLFETFILNFEDKTEPFNN